MRGENFMLEHLQLFGLLSLVRSDKVNIDIYCGLHLFLILSVLQSELKFPLFQEQASKKNVYTLGRPYPSIENPLY